MLKVVPSKPPSELVRAVDDYLAAKRAEGLSPKTVRYAMGFPLREIFLPWCAENDVTEVDQLDSRTTYSLPVASKVRLGDG